MDFLYRRNTYFARNGGNKADLAADITERMELKYGDNKRASGCKCNQ